MNLMEREYKMMEQRLLQRNYLTVPNQDPYQTSPRQSCISDKCREYNPLVDSISDQLFSKEPPVNSNATIVADW